MGSIFQNKYKMWVWFFFILENKRINVKKYNEKTGNWETSVCNVGNYLQYKSIYNDKILDIGDLCFVFFSWLV